MWRGGLNIRKAVSAFITSRMPAGSLVGGGSPKQTAEGTVSTTADLTDVQRNDDSASSTVVVCSTCPAPPKPWPRLQGAKAGPASGNCSACGSGSDVIVTPKTLPLAVDQFKIFRFGLHDGFISCDFSKTNVVVCATKHDFPIARPVTSYSKHAVALLNPRFADSAAADAMAKQPSVIIIARHGARLDQANDAWSDTAAKPYDPPLTYSGWLQCQMLGSRIENELRFLDRGTSVKEATEPPRKRRKIIIHSSPYLRCLQTSVAIGAGMREVHPPPRSSLPPTSMPTSTPLQKVISQEEVDIQPNTNGASEKDSFVDMSATDIPTAPKTKLRVDGFLGEWLSPSYFERSGAPPASEELLEEAKKVFSIPAEEIKGADMSMPAIVEFSGVDWEYKETELSSKPIHEKTGLRAMAAAGHAMSKRPRHSTSQEKQNGSLSKAACWQVVGYSPPVPTYSLAPRDGIPIGFVAHARDACLAFDTDWDSTRDSLDWGDGGPFGEEWSSMHRRFRNGLQRMMAFYESSSLKTEDESSEDLVLILVTHQAGANALIRLLTGAPALHDIGTASLTMAVRRPQPLERRVSEQKSTSPVARRGSLDLGIADDFEMKIIASTEHLRGRSNPLGLNSPRLGTSPALASRKAVGADSPEGFSIGDPMTRSKSGHGLGLGRSPSQRSYAADDIPAIQSGLWRRDSASTDTDTDADIGTWERAANANTSVWGSSESRLGSSLPLRSASQRGMWGGESSIRRDRSPGKRRWTAVDRSP